MSNVLYLSRRRGGRKPPVPPHQDRASAVATAVVQLTLRAFVDGFSDLSSAAATARVEVASYLRDELADIAREIAADRRLSD